MRDLPLTSISWLGTQLSLHGEPLRAFLRRHRRELPVVLIGDTAYVPTAKVHAVLGKIAKRARPARPSHIEDLRV